MEKDQIAPVLLVRPGQESNRLLELISENCCVKKKCGSEMCGGRQASTLSKLLRKRHPSTRYPLSPAQCTNGSPQPYPIVSFADFRRRSSRFFVTCTERAIHRAIDCKDA